MIKPEILEEEKLRLQAVIASAQSDLIAVNRLLGIDTSILGQLRLSEAVRKIFEESEPLTLWTPPEIRDELLLMKEQGILRTKVPTKDLLTGAHRVIKRFLDNGLIELVREQTEPVPRKWYKWLS